MTHPYFFTWQAQRGATPVQITGGEGAWFETDAGRVLDLGALVYQANAGHGHRRIIDAVKAQADSLCLATPSTDFPAKRELAEMLLAKAPPGFSKVFFCLGGSDANENALKIARLHTGRYKSIARYRSYHGASLGAVSLTGDWRRAPIEPGIPGVIHVLDLDEGVAETQIPRTLALEENVGAVVLESVVGANGVLIPPPGYLEAVRSACDAHGALLILDEVLVGFGRTGRFFALDHFGVVPDMITVGKALTAGYGVLGAVLVHDRVAATFDERVLACGLTHYAHPLGVAAAREALRVYDDEGLVENAAALEPALRAGLEEVAARVANSRVRCLGLLGGAHVDFDAEQLARLRNALTAREVFVHVKGSQQIRGPGGMLILSPPLCISQAELEEGFRRIHAALDDVM
ncbi:MAG: aminotransferase class III-fold pyridoxal phosphate-dependent enzyme [Myxococcota bacterium]